MSIVAKRLSYCDRPSSPRFAACSHVAWMVRFGQWGCQARGC